MPPAGIAEQRRNFRDEVFTLNYMPRIKELR